MCDAEHRVNPHLKVDSKALSKIDTQQIEAYIEALGSWPFSVPRDQWGLN